jgi:hypothetical protein
VPPSWCSEISVVKALPKCLIAHKGRLAGTGAYAYTTRQ